MYKIKAFGYGGSGPSLPPIVSNDIEFIKKEIGDLVTTDHAVRLYSIEEDGAEKSIDFDFYLIPVVYISEDSK